MTEIEISLNTVSTTLKAKEIELNQQLNTFQQEKKEMEMTTMQSQTDMKEKMITYKKECDEKFKMTLSSTSIEMQQVKYSKATQEQL